MKYRIQYCKMKIIVDIKSLNIVTGNTKFLFAYVNIKDNLIYS